MEDSKPSKEMVALVIGGFVVAALIGGALGVLLAPDKGSETRKKLFSKAGALPDNLKEKFNSFIEEIKVEMASAKERENGIAGNGSEN